ncbi:hypothetical protein EfmAA610_23970 [Enterococcus faecium]|nr:hypothetical protein EfmAA610_23970 [Enterococcus faecium]
MRAKPHEVKLMMIDPKMVELLAPEEGRVLLAPVVTTPVNKYSVDIEDLMVDTER